MLLSEKKVSHLFWDWSILIPLSTHCCTRYPHGHPTRWCARFLHRPRLLSIRVIRRIFNERKPVRFIDDSSLPEAQRITSANECLKPIVFISFGPKKSGLQKFLHLLGVWFMANCKMQQYPAICVGGLECFLDGLGISNSTSACYYLRLQVKRSNLKSTVKARASQVNAPFGGDCPS